MNQAHSTACRAHTGQRNMASVKKEHFTSVNSSCNKIFCTYVLQIHAELCQTRKLPIVLFRKKCNKHELVVFILEKKLEMQTNRWHNKQFWLQLLFPMISLCMQMFLNSAKMQQNVSNDCKKTITPWQHVPHREMLVSCTMHTVQWTVQMPHSSACHPRRLRSRFRLKKLPKNVSITKDVILLQQYTIEYRSYLPPTKEEVYVFASVRLSAYVSESKITQKGVHGFGRNVACQQMSGHGRTDELFSPIQISPNVGTGLLSPISYALQRGILLRQENPTYRWAAAMHGFTMVLFTLSRRNNFVNMTTNCCSPPNCNTLSDVEWCTYNANFLKIPWWFMALLPMLRVTHIMPVLVLLSVVTGGGRNATLHDLKPYI